MNIGGMGGAQFNPYQSQAMQGTGSCRSGRPKDIDVNDIINSKDSNGDGVLAAGETGMPEEIFAKADANGDGFLTQGEFEEMLANGGGRSGGVGRPEGVGGMSGNQLDIDALFGDTDSITEEEALAAGVTDQIISGLDKDGDGNITKDEIELALENRNEGTFLGSGSGSVQTMALTAYQEAMDNYMSNFSTDTNMYASRFFGAIA